MRAKHVRSDSAIEPTLQINVINASSDSTAPRQHRPTIRQRNNSDPFVDILVKVAQGPQFLHKRITIDTSRALTGILSDVDEQLSSLRRQLRIAENASSDRVYILSGRGPEVKRPLCTKKHLEKALDTYCSQAFTIFEIQDTITEPSSTNFTTYRQKVQARIRANRTQGQYNGPFITSAGLLDILPESEIRKVLHEDEELRKLPSPVLASLVNQMSQDGLKLLATILTTDVQPFGNLLQSFATNDMLDAEMPFEPQKCCTFLRSTSYLYEKICHAQWQFFPLALDFYSTDEPTEYSHEVIIPLVEMKLLNKGGFGDVYEVLLKDCSQQGVESRFAMKRFKRANEKSELDFDREVKALKGISGKSNAHLMKLIAAFRHGEDFLEFFPLAECSLKACFKINRIGNKSYFIWMTSQLFGLAEGLHAIHGDADTTVSSTMLAIPNQPQINDEILGYHHDLKADNILLLKGSDHISRTLGALEELFGTLQISDFGLGRFRPASTGSVSVHVKGTQTYAAPEAQNGGQSRPYDIWSFGCMMIEIYTWLLEGPNGLTNFMESRDTVINTDDSDATTDCYWVKRKNAAVLNPAVQRQIQSIESQEVFPEFKDSITQLMAVVSKCLSINPKKRPKAREVCEHLENISKQVANSNHVTSARLVPSSTRFTRPSANLVVPNFHRQLV